MEQFTISILKFKIFYETEKKNFFFSIFNFPSISRANKPVCLKCFHSSSSTITCTTCRIPFSSETPHMSQGDLHWHASGQCFCCCVCSKNLLGVKYSRVGESLYCGYQTCGGEDEELLDEDRLGSPRRQLSHKSTRVVKIPASPRVPRGIQMPSGPLGRPKPPQRAPPPPPSENIYETVMPCSSTNSPNFDKKYCHEVSRNQKRPSESYQLSDAYISQSQLLLEDAEQVVPGYGRLQYFFVF